MIYLPKFETAPKLTDTELRSIVEAQNDCVPKLLEKVNALISVVEGHTTMLATLSAQNTDLISQVRNLTEKNAKFLAEKSTVQQNGNNSLESEPEEMITVGPHKYALIC